MQKPLSSLLDVSVIGLVGVCLNACAVSGSGGKLTDLSGKNSHYALNSHDGSRYRRLDEKELLALLPRLSDDQRAVALAFLFLRFAPDRTLQSLAKWKAVWQEFPRTQFYSDFEPNPFRMGPMIFKEGIGDHSFASITIDPGSPREFSIMFALSAIQGHFEQILRGTMRDDTGCKVLDVCCILPNGRTFLRK